MSVSTDELGTAAGTAANALDTATQMTDAAIRRRARLPLSMTTTELDTAVRRRVEDAHRHVQPGPKVAGRGRPR